jgi:hypothetical protein
MRFDAERAAALAATLESGREPGTPELEAAADACADLLAGAGLRVSRGTRIHHCEPPPASRTVIGGSIVAGLLLALTSRVAGLLIGPDPYTLALGFGGLAALGLLERRLTLGTWWRCRVAVPVIEARRAPAAPGTTAAAATVRVVFVARLDSIRSRRSGWMRVILSLAEIAWILTLVGGSWAIGPWFWLGLAGPWLMVALGVMALLGRATYATAPAPRDGRTGLAVLIEMARGWSSGRSDPRLDPVFVAIVAADDERETLAYLRSFEADLIVVFLAPGAGPERLVLAGPGRDEALAVAADLRVPAALGTAVLKVPAGFIVTGREHAATATTASTGAGLAAAAQVAYEAALRRAGGARPESRS